MLKEDEPMDYKQEKEQDSEKRLFKEWERTLKGE